jgi:hypothetical protein
MWHPEAYGVYATDSRVPRTHRQCHNRLLLNMVKAGEVDQTRRKVLRNLPDLKEWVFIWAFSKLSVEEIFK